MSLHFTGIGNNVKVDIFFMNFIKCILFVFSIKSIFNHFRAGNIYNNFNSNEETLKAHTSQKVIIFHPNQNLFFFILFLFCKGDFCFEVIFNDLNIFQQDTKFINLKEMDYIL